MNWTRENMAYIAGLLALIGLGKVFGPYMKLGNSKVTPKKPIYQYKLSTKEHVYAVCAAVYEFMGTRRKQAIKNLMVAYNNA